AHNHEFDSSEITGIIRPRVEETLDLVRQKLEDTGLDKIAGRRAVLTGGASQLPGMLELAEAILNKHVRLAVPNALPGLPLSFHGPAFATPVGLIDYAGLPEDTPSVIAFEEQATNPRFGKVVGWLRENF